MQEIDPAATAWLLAATALVLLMTPGLAIFYGGMVRTTGVLNMIMMSFISIPLVTVAWLLVGYTLAFSEDAGGGLIGNLAALRHARHRPDHAARRGARIAVRHLPAGLRDRHRRTGQRRHRRPRQVRGVGGVRPAVDGRGVRRGRALGVGAGRLAVRARRARLRGRPGRRNRLRHVGAGAGSGARPAHRFQEGRDAPAQPAVRAARLRPAVVRLVRVQRRLRAGRQRDGLGGLPQHAGRRLPRHAGLAHRRADPRRQADHVRRRLGCGRRTGRDHAVLRNGEHPRRRRSSGWPRASSARSRSG